MGFALFLQIAPQPDDSSRRHSIWTMRACVCGSQQTSVSRRSWPIAARDRAQSLCAPSRGIANGLVDRLLNGKFENPILGLLGSHLLLGAPEIDPHRARTVVDNTAHLLGEEFPDIICLALTSPALNLAPPPLPLMLSRALLCSQQAGLRLTKCGPIRPILHSNIEAFPVSLYGRADLDLVCMEREAESSNT